MTTPTSISTGCEFRTLPYCVSCPRQTQPVVSFPPHLRGGSRQPRLRTRLGGSCNQTFVCHIGRCGERTNTPHFLFLTYAWSRDHRTHLQEAELSAILPPPSWWVSVVRDMYIYPALSAPKTRTHQKSSMFTGVKRWLVRLVRKLNPHQPFLACFRPLFLMLTRPGWTRRRRLPVGVVSSAVQSFTVRNRTRRGRASRETLDTSVKQCEQLNRPPGHNQKDSI